MEVTSTPEPASEFISFFSVSSGDVLSGDSDSELSEDTPAESEETGAGSTIVLSGSPEYEAALQQLLCEVQEIKETQSQVLASNQRLELQFEACISILMIFMVVGLLNYIYKFFKMFF